MERVGSATAASGQRRIALLTILASAMLGLAGVPARAQKALTTPRGTGRPKLERAAQLTLARDLQNDGRTSARERKPILLFFDREECPYCEQALREYLVPLSREGWKDRALFRQIEIDRRLPLVDFDGNDHDARRLRRALARIAVADGAGRRWKRQRPVRTARRPDDRRLLRCVPRERARRGREKTRSLTAIIGRSTLRETPGHAHRDHRWRRIPRPQACARDPRPREPDRRRRHDARCSRGRSGRCRRDADGRRFARSGHRRRPGGRGARVARLRVERRQRVPPRGRRERRGRAGLRPRLARQRRRDAALARGMPATIVAAEVRVHELGRRVRRTASRRRARRPAADAAVVVRRAEGGRRDARARLHAQRLPRRPQPAAADGDRAARQAEQGGVVVRERHRARAAERCRGRVPGAAGNAHVADVAARR